MIYAAQDPALLERAGAVLGVRFDPKACAWVSNVSDDGEVLAVVVYTRFSPWNCEMSVASSSPRWASRKFIRAAFQYPFQQCRLRRVTAAVEPDNAASIFMLERLGFIREATLAEWFGEKDAHIYRMTRKECKWLTH